MIKQYQFSVKWLLNNQDHFNFLEKALEGPDAEILNDAFQVLLGELDYIDSNLVVVFRALLEDNVVQIILSSGHMMDITVDKEYLCDIKNEEEFSVTTQLYYRLVRAIEEELPEKHKYNVALVEPPTPSTGFLTSPEDGDTFCGEFYYLDNPEKIFGWTVRVVDINEDRLKAEIYPYPL